jgi:hypothetical protein
MTARTTGGLRRRAPYAALALGTIVLGLGVRRGGAALGPAARDVAGDALWAAMLAWWVGALLPRRPLGLRAALALAGCVAVELSQLVHAPGLDAARRTPLGRLVLGSDFDARDLLAYAAGVLAAAALERAWTAARRGRLGRRDRAGRGDTARRPAG